MEGREMTLPEALAEYKRLSNERREYTPEEYRAALKELKEKDGGMGWYRPAGDPMQEGNKYP